MMKFRWDKLGGQLGILYCVVGLFLIFLGWNGAASYDRVQAQIPYLISGGIAGLALVVIGSAMLIGYGHRADRAALQSTIEDLRDVLERGAGGAGPAAVDSTATPGDIAVEVVAGTDSYHRPDCQLVEGQSGLTAMSVEAAQQRNLDPCRICNP
jgi:hypothetical protein